MRLVAYLILLAVFSCDNGPRVTWCITDPVLYGCSDGSSASPESFEEWACLSPRDTERLLTACKDRTTADVNYCLVASGGVDLICADGSFVSIVQGVNYSCLGPKDAERLLDYCARRRRGE